MIIIEHTLGHIFLCHLNNWAIFSEVLSTWQVASKSMAIFLKSLMAAELFWKSGPVMGVEHF